MRFQVSLEPADYTAFVKFVLKTRTRSPNGRPKSWLRGLAIWIGLVALFVGIFRVVDARPGELFSSSSFVPFAFIGMFLALFVYFFRDYEKKLQPSEDGPVLGRHEYEIGVDGVRDSVVHIETFVRWSGVRELLESDAHLFLMTDVSSGMIWPKRCFDSEAELSKVRDLVRRSIVSAA